MSWISRMFMGPAQKSLVNTRDYHEVLDPTEIKAEIEAGKSGIQDWETLDYMADAVTHFPEGELTIANVVESRKQLSEALSEANSEDMREFLVEHHIGADALAGYLIQRANRLAASVKSGAPDALGHAFGADA